MKEKEGEWGERGVERTSCAISRKRVIARCNRFNPNTVIFRPKVKAEEKGSLSPEKIGVAKHKLHALVRTEHFLFPSAQHAVLGC